MREDFDNWWEKEGQYSDLCGKELCSIAWSNGEYKAFKELTDNEIKAVYGEYFDVKNCDWLHLQCIKAIIKKAMQQ